MPLFHLIVLAIVQGITEFLPISSSGHLVLVPLLTGWEDQGVHMDVAVHFGTLFAVAWYCRGQLIEMTSAALHYPKQGITPPLRLGLLLVLATIPVILAGFFIKDHLPDLRNLWVIGFTTLFFGILLGLADRRPAKKTDLERQPWQDALYIGLAQILALIPGTSRSGITMTMSRFLGYERQAAAQFSFLLAVPVILGGTVLATKDVLDAGVDGYLGDMLIAAALSAAVAFLAIKALMAWLAKSSFMPFVWYRIVLGIGLLALAWMQLENDIDTFYDSRVYEQSPANHD